MKIKTITCHNVYNFGASLQAYALMTYLRSLGNDVEIIDYMPSYIQNNLSLWAIGARWNKNIFMRFAFYCYVVPIRIMQAKTRKKYDLFSDKYFKLTQKYNSFEELKKNPPKADIFFCGSDQIWNPNIENGLDPSFYVDFVPKNSIRASYAASFSVSELEYNHKFFIKQMLSKMDFISVREKTGVDLILSMGGDNIVAPKNVVDPVFLLDKKHWMQMSVKPKYENYILVYDQENSSVIKQISKYISKKENLKIVAFKDLYRRDYADYVEAYAGPIEFISLIANANVVISNSFHCTAFSLIMNKEIYVVPRTHQKVNSRMADLLSTLNISDRLVDSIDAVNSSEKIDYLNVDLIIEKMKQFSYKYIDEVLVSKE